MADKDLQTINNSGDITGLNLGGTASTDAVLDKGEIDASYQDLAGNSAITKSKYTPQATAPTYVEGQFFYDQNEEVFTVQGPIDGPVVRVGHNMHIHIENNSGGIIEKGMAVRSNGVISGKIQVVKALADTFTNATVIGIADHDIADGADGVVSTHGLIIDFNTSLLAVGGPYYLSDTVAGTYTKTRPSIATRIGGIVVSDATNGRLRVHLDELINPPTVFGGMTGQTIGNETYNLTTTSQDIINYDVSKEIVTTVDKLTGEITLPNDGSYRMHFTSAISFTSSTSTRSITVELYDVTGATIHFPYVKNIPRDATEDSFSFDWALDESANNVHKMRIKASTTMNVTFNEISFDIQSISIT